MNIEEMLEISDCPLCEGGALLEEECGCGYYVMCLEGGCHSVTIDFLRGRAAGGSEKGSYTLEYRQSDFQQSRRMMWQE